MGNGRDNSVKKIHIQSFTVKYFLIHLRPYKKEPKSNPYNIKI